MPRYFFHIFDGVDIRDYDGVELPDLTFARREALRYAGSLLDQASKRSSLGREWRMDVTDAKGLILFSLSFLVTDAPAVSGLEIARPD